MGIRQIEAAGRGRIPWLVLLSIWVLAHLASAGGISNLRVSQRPGSTLLDIYYDLAATATNGLFVGVTISTNGGLSYDLAAHRFTGDVGEGITPGANKWIVWDAGRDWPNQYSTNLFFRVIASETAGLPFNTIAAPPPIALTLPAVVSAEGQVRNSVVASPPLFLALPELGELASGWAAPNTVAALPPLMLMLPDSGARENNLAPNITVALPALTLSLPFLADPADFGFNAVVGQPPVFVGFEDP